MTETTLRTGFGSRFFARTGPCGLGAAILGVALVLAGILPVSAAQVTGQTNIPTPYIPSTTLAVDEMLRVADVKPGDFVVDLGSGDGRIVIAAARDYGARGLGIDIDPMLIEESTENARKAGVADRVTFRQGDALKADIREATVVTLYLLPNLVERLKPVLLKQLKPGTRIVAHDFPFSDWKPDRQVTISKNYYLYVVPARVGGKWRIEAELPDGKRDYEIDFDQNFQRIKGGARVEGGYLPAFDAQLDGDRIRFVLVENQQTSHHFEGQVDGWTIAGVVRSGPGRERVTGRWRATRVTS
jgi:SAM-dependent methyltransferase